MANAFYGVRTSTKRRENNEGGGRHEADHIFGIVCSVDDCCLDAPVDRRPGTGGAESENCHTALVGVETETESKPQRS